MFEKRGRVAQWIEQQIPVLWVGGSNPSALVLLNNTMMSGLLAVGGLGALLVSSRFLCKSSAAA